MGGFYALLFHYYQNGIVICFLLSPYLHVCPLRLSACGCLSFKHIRICQCPSRDHKQRIILGSNDDELQAWHVKSVSWTCQGRVRVASFQKTVVAKDAMGGSDGRISSLVNNFVSLQHPHTILYLNLNHVV